MATFLLPPPTQHPPALRGINQTLKLEPQPQVVVALGFLITN